METKKLIVTDLDGTALQNWETLDPNTKEALIAAKEAGHIVVIATGRPARASLHFYKELGLDTPIINFNGAYIHHPEDETFEDIVAQIPTEVVLTPLPPPPQAVSMVTAITADSARDNNFFIFIIQNLRPNFTQLQILLSHSTVHYLLTQTPQLLHNRSDCPRAVLCSQQPYLQPSSRIHRLSDLPADSLRS